MRKVMNWLGAKGVCLGIVVALLVIIGLQNMEPVTIQILFWRVVDMSKLLFIFVTVGGGFLTGFAFAKWPSRRGYSNQSFQRFEKSFQP